MKRTAMLMLALSVGAGCAPTDSSQSFNPAPPTPANTKDVAAPEINADTHFAAAQLAATRGSFPQAVDQYDAALKLKPDHLGALYGLGCLQTQLHDYKDAIIVWKRYVKATGGSSVAYSDLAFCEEASGDAKSAEGDYKKGIARDSRDESCRVNYGLLLARQGRIIESLVQLRSVLSEAEVRYNLASVYESQGKKAQAMAEYKKASDLDPNLADAKAKLASLN